MAWAVGTDSAGRATVCERNRGVADRLICRPNPCAEDGLGATDVARLMAASPALLRELKRLLAMWEEAIGYEPDYMNMADRARAAIAKAEGRSE